MPKVSQNYFRAAAVFLLVGIAIGLQMSISGAHAVAGAHAHLSLLGWVSCAIFGTYFALDKGRAESRLATLQFWIIVLSCAVMSGGLYFLLLGYAAMMPVVAIASLAYAAGSALFFWIVFSSHASASAPRGRVHG